MIKHQVYVGLGSNLGDCRKNLERAIRLIGYRAGLDIRHSYFIETEPLGFESPYKFMNAVILCETTRSPREVLLLTQQIESDMGRMKKSVSGGYADRAIDIDILLYDDVTIDESDLKILHPLVQQRDFVMRTLNEIKTTKPTKTTET